MNNNEFKKVVLLKSIYDDGAEYSPPGYIASEGDVVYVKEIKDNKLYVHHQHILNNSFIVYEGEYKYINDLEHLFILLKYRKRKSVGKLVLSRNLLLGYETYERIINTYPILIVITDEKLKKGFLGGLEFGVSLERKEWMEIL